MGRLREELKKIENKTHRHIAFSKRKNGLLKKAFEISTICDAEVALILFSPSGKLFLFDGKKRFEEIVKHYIDHVIKERKRLNDHESLEMLLSQMTVEEDVYNHWALTSGIRTSAGSSVEDLLKEINVVQDEIDELEGQIRCFTRSPKSLKTLSDAEIHEELWEGTLKRVQIRKLVLIAKKRIELPAASDHDQIDASASARGFMIGNSSHNFDSLPPPPAQAQAQPQAQIDFTVPLMDASGGSNCRSQPFSFSNQPHYDAAGIQQPSPKLLHHVHGYPMPSCPPQSNGQNTNVYMPQPQDQLGQFTTGNLPSGANTTDQLGGEEEASSSATETGFFVTSSQYHNSGYPFPF